jgi:hypothetical protein
MRQSFGMTGLEGYCSTRYGQQDGSLVCKDL